MLNKLQKINAISCNADGIIIMKLFDGLIKQLPVIIIGKSRTTLSFYKARWRKSLIFLYRLPIKDLSSLRAKNMRLFTVPRGRFK